MLGAVKTNKQKETTDVKEQGQSYLCARTWHSCNELRASSSAQLGKKGRGNEVGSQCFVHQSSFESIALMGFAHRHVHIATKQTSLMVSEIDEEVRETGSINASNRRWIVEKQTNMIKRTK